MIAMALVLAGWALLATSQPKHFNRIVRHGHLPNGFKIAMRSVGAALLLAALVVLARAEGLSFGALIWGCLLSVSAMAVALILAWLPKFTSVA